MAVVGNILHFLATFFIKIESQRTVDNRRMAFYISGVQGEVVVDLATNWLKENVLIPRGRRRSLVLFSSPK